jgi:hypothetical protein
VDFTDKSTLSGNRNSIKVTIEIKHLRKNLRAEKKALNKKM